MSEPVSPQAIAEYDQALSSSEGYLSYLVSLFIDERKKNEAKGYPEAVTVVGCSVFLSEEVPHEACASALAVAILAIARMTEREQKSE